MIISPFYQIPMYFILDLLLNRLEPKIIVNVELAKNSVLTTWAGLDSFCNEVI